MIGTSVIFIPIFIYIFIISLYVYYIKRMLNSEKEAEDEDGVYYYYEKSFPLFQTIFFPVIIYIFALYSISQIKDSDFIYKLNEQDISYIKIGEEKITTRANINKVVTSLKKNDYILSLDRLNVITSFDIVFKDKNLKTFKLSLYKNGVVIKSKNDILKLRGLHNMFGIYSPTLPKVLKGIGIDLPKGNND